MAFWDNWVNNIRQAIRSFIMPEDATNPARIAHLESLALHRAYVRGLMRDQIKTKPGQADDNLIVNFVGLIVDRAVSMLYGAGIKFDLPGEDETPQDVLIDETWKANSKAILLYKLGYFGATYGTTYAKLIPAGRDYNGTPLTRIVALHPMWVQIEHAPEDMERVNKYIIAYSYAGKTGDVARKQEIERVVSEAGDTLHWLITDYIADKSTGGKWAVMGTPMQWAYEFAPIVHWQNLPDPEGCYGKSDIDNIFGPQDRFNFVSSNISKIIRLHAHPRTWGRNVTTTSNASWGPDEMVLTNSPDALISNLEMQSDLASSRAFGLDLRQMIFDLSRTVDIASMADKVGSLTNFGLRVLFKDELAKTNTKRELYEDGLLEINRRILQLAGYTGEQADPGSVIWPDPLPVNDLEKSQSITADLGNGLVSKQTASMERGYDWEQEQERMADDRASGDNVGAAILRAFNQGQ